MASGKAKSKARRAAAKKKSSSSSSSSKSTKSSSSSSSSSSKSSSNSKAPSVNYTFDSRKESASQYNARIERERQAVRDYNTKTVKEDVKSPVEVVEDKQKKTTTPSGVSLDQLRASAEYKTLSKDQRDAVEAVYLAIGENNAQSAERLVAAFQAAEKLADPFFKQQIRLAKDAVERGFVEIDKELDFSRVQAERRLQDLRTDIQSQSEYLTIEEQNDLKSLERDYIQTLDSTRQSLAATGLSSSSVRAEKEQIIEEVTGDLREGTKRKFGYQKEQLKNTLQRGERDTSSEINRLAEVAKGNKLGLFRRAEEQLGSANLPSLNFDARPLGNINGTINTDKQNDIIGAVKNLVF